jgi:hypothetical protein
MSLGPGSPKVPAVVMRLRSDIQTRKEAKEYRENVLKKDPEEIELEEIEKTRP